MIEYFTENQYAGWFMLGFLLLAIEMLLFGFATGFVLFIGLAALLTGAFIWFGLIEQSWLAGVACFGISSALISALLYVPLKKLQNSGNTDEKDTSSDIVGMEFRLEQDISFTQLGTTRYSGLEWKVEIDKEAKVQTIPTGTLVTVVSVDVALFRVKPV